MIMYDLGFPADALEAVRGLYTGAVTTFSTPLGDTEALAVDRGTIQGDGLSPLLFAIYLEPLLRWLHVGGRGYLPRCLQRHAARTAAADGCAAATADHISSCTYADDLNIPAETTADIALQAGKVDAFAAWGDLQVNLSKSTATAALHQNFPQTPYDAGTVQRRLAGKIKIAGQEVKIASPRQPFKFLGVTLTMDLDWKHHLRDLAARARAKAAALAKSPLTGTQKHTIIETSPRPSLTYGASLVPFSAAQLAIFDSILATLTKKAHGLHASAGSAFAHEAKSAGGLGGHSLMVETARQAVQRLTRGLNDAGRLGRLTRALLTAQLELFTGAAPDLQGCARPAWLRRYSVGLRRLELAERTHAPPVCCE